MQVQQQNEGCITFQVHEVLQATEPRKTVKTRDSASRLVGSVIEACSDYTDDCLEDVAVHPLIAATHIAFSEHRPLVLSPDMIWTTIVQGLAQHVRKHPEELRNRFVSHQGKLRIQVERDDIHKGSPENPWSDVIHQFSEAIRERLGSTYERLIADFSTTGPTERTACEVALLDTFQPYFELVLYCICGIPEITLEGTTTDWKRLREKIEFLEAYDLDWWLASLRPVADHFVRASSGDVDLSHWRNIYKREEAYGYEKLNGWMVTLIPYLKCGCTGNYSVRNPFLSDPNASVSSKALPSGVSEVPFLLKSRSGETAMAFLGGLLGVTQDKHTFALRPKLGWAVRQQDEVHQLLVRLGKHNPAPPLAPHDFDKRIEKLVRSPQRIPELPGDFLLFYKNCDGVTLFADIPSDAVRFHSFQEVEIVELQAKCPAGWPRSSLAWQTGVYARFCDFPDGSFAALELAMTCLPYEDGMARGWKIVHQRQGAEEPVVIALSFQDFLTRALEGGRVGLTNPIAFKKFESYQFKRKK